MNIPIKLLFLLTFIILINNYQDDYFIDQSSSNNKNEWISLFNGKNLDNWIVKIKGFPLNQNAYNTFRVENGNLIVSYDKYESFNNTFGHIFYKSPFTNYKLRLQYRFVGDQVKGGEDWAKKNSGVMIHSQSPESMELDQSFPVSLEVQLLGGFDKNIKRPTANLCTPGTHVTMDNQLITKHCINSSSKTYYDDQWIDLEILVFHDSIIKHFIEGKEVISYTKPIIGGEYNSLKNKEGKSLKSGYISLQSESHPIEFRNIELMELDL
ncbi:MAG: DUF1080 domain-containing protein [Bacteroidota bacterium]